MVKVLIADDHALVRESLRRAIEQAGHVVVAEAGDGAEAVELAMTHHPDVVLMDLSLPVLSGIAATRQIRGGLPGVPVLVLTMLADEMAVSSAMAAGASGFVVKDAASDDIVRALERVAAGEIVITPSLAPGTDGDGGGQRARPVPAATVPLVTRREEEVLRMMATGVSIAEAAERLYISVKTVKNHLASIYQKLDSHDRAQAVLKAMRMGIISIG